MSDANKRRSSFIPIILLGLSLRAMRRGLMASVPTSRIVFPLSSVPSLISKAFSISGNSSKASVHISKSFFRFSTSLSHNLAISQADDCFHKTFSHQLAILSLISITLGMLKRFLFTL